VPVTVSPAEFSLVRFDAPAIAEVAAMLLDRLGMAELDLAIEVDETTPIARISAIDGDPIVVSVESGAFEDPKRPRHQSSDAIVTSLGRVLLRIRDRRRGAFEDAPADVELTLAEAAAWDAYAVGRLAAAGYGANRQRWLYNFRNRHGFTDAADQAFEALWGAEGLSWDQLSALSDEARAAGQLTR